MTQGYRESANEDRSILVTAFAGKLFGLHRDDGCIAWTRLLGGGHEVEILIDCGRVYATQGREVHCVDYETGELVWEVKMPNAYEGRPTMVVERDHLFVGSAGEVSCLSLQGEVVWTQHFVNMGIGAVALGFPGNVRQAADWGGK